MKDKQREKVSKKRKESEEAKPKSNYKPKQKLKPAVPTLAKLNQQAQIPLREREEPIIHGTKRSIAVGDDKPLAPL